MKYKAYLGKFALLHAWVIEHINPINDFLANF